MNQEQLLLEWNDKILEFMLKYRSTHPGFKFWLRSKESTRSDKKDRLKSGTWFQGSDYIFVSFHNGSGHINMTRSIGWVVKFDDSGQPHYHISIVWKGETDKRLIATYEAILSKLGGFQPVDKDKYMRRLPDKELFESLTEFIEETLPMIDQIIHEQGTENLLAIPDEKFDRQLTRVLQIRSELQSGNSAKEGAKKQKEVEKARISLNTILYGPPGTGKTFNSIGKAVEIADKTFYDGNKANRDALTQRFRELYIHLDKENPEGQIGFCTFHQSMSYEEFVEGIKPDLSGADSGISYTIKDGIFKRLCRMAANKFDIKDNFTAAYGKLLQEIEDNDGSLVLKTVKMGKEFTIYENSKGNLRFHANTEKAYEGVIIKEYIETYLKTGELVDWPSYTKGVGEYLKTKFGYTNQQMEVDRNYVLIIDEINRGNIAQVFGELITLIEDDKRTGMAETLTITLPYSKKSFSVPSNLYIIGTMNTADRSVEALDTALRRRFTFEQISPDESLLSPQNLIIRLYAKYPETDWNDKVYRKDADQLYALIGIDKSFEKTIRQDDKPDYADDDKIRKLKTDQFSGLNLQTLLSIINRRLEALLTKDHTIGHAWLMNVFSLGDLRAAFKNKILPLLQEFFYNDYAKIGLVLGNEFVDAEAVESKLFAKFKGDEDLAGEYTEKIIYKLKDPNDITLEGFKSIYTGGK